MIEWGDVLFYGTFLAGGIVRLIYHRKKPKENTGLQKLSYIGNLFFCFFAASALALAFLPDGNYRRYVIPIPMIAAAIYLIIAVFVFVRARKEKKKE